jgi:hypothetical protein
MTARAAQPRRGALCTGNGGLRCGLRARHQHRRAPMWPLGTRAGSQHASAWGVRLMARGYAAARPRCGYGRSSPRASARPPLARARRLLSAGNGAWLGTSAGVRPRARSAPGTQALLALARARLPRRKRLWPPAARSGTRIWRLGKPPFGRGDGWIDRHGFAVAAAEGGAVRLKKTNRCP